MNYLVYWVRLRIGDIIGNSATFVRSETTCNRDFGKQTSIRSSVSHLHWVLYCRCNLAANVHAIVHNWKSVEHGTVGFKTLLNTNFAFFVSVQTGVAVYGRGQQVGSAFVFEEAQQLYVLFVECHTGTWLNECVAIFYGFLQLVREAFLRCNALLVIYCFLEVYIFPRLPLVKDVGSFLEKLVVG